MTSDRSNLFVYGTLLETAAHPMSTVLRTHATPLGPGEIQARLYQIAEIDAQGYNTYPGAVPSGVAEDRVHGMLYHVHAPEPLFARLDVYEACNPGAPEPFEFLLRPIDVIRPDGSTLRAVSYFYAWDTSRATLIPSGRFTDRAPDVR